MWPGPAGKAHHRPRTDPAAHGLKEPSRGVLERLGREPGTWDGYGASEHPAGGRPGGGRGWTDGSWTWGCSHGCSRGCSQPGAHGLRWQEGSHKLPHLKTDESPRASKTECGGEAQGLTEDTGPGRLGPNLAGRSPLPRRPPWGVQVTHLRRPLGHHDTSHLVATFRPEGDGPRPLRSRRQPTRKPRLTSGIRKTDVTEADLALTTMERVQMAGS